jgi:hypothetical protein
MRINAESFVDESLGETGDRFVAGGGSSPEPLGDLVRQPHGHNFTHVYLVVGGREVDGPVDVRFGTID